MRRPVRELDRHLYFYRGSYYYRRKVPKALLILDNRGAHVKRSLHTDDLAAARQLRDQYEKADNELWAALLSGLDENIAFAKYEEARLICEANSVQYTTASRIAAGDSVVDIISRIYAANTDSSNKPANAALLGVHTEPGIKISRVLQLYIDELCASEMRMKSPAQRESWAKVKRRAVKNFIKCCTDLPITEINRSHALAFHAFWLKQIAPKTGVGTHAPTTGNRDVGNMRVIYNSYMKHIGKKDFQNPFDGLAFSDKKKKTRPPFATDFIRDTIMTHEKLGNLNPEARGIMLAMIETGCRPSELCNIKSENIHINHKIPHITVKASEDAANPRDIKTNSSERTIPLLGVALEVFKVFPKGFPKYHDKENLLSAVLMKHFKARDLLPTIKHKIYSIRHSFEDRMKDGGLDTELRMMLMGHAIDRPTYGSGGSIEWKQTELKKITLPFDPSIVLPPKPVRGSRRA